MKNITKMFLFILSFYLVLGSLWIGKDVIIHYQNIDGLPILGYHGVLEDIPTKMLGTGRYIIGPIAIYINGINKTIEDTNRRFMLFRFSSARSFLACHSLRKLLSFAPACSGNAAP